MATTLRLGIVSDIHIAPEGTAPTGWHNPFDFAGTVDRLQRAVECFNLEEVDGVVALGDLTHVGDSDSVAEALAPLAAAPGRLWIAPGNHDVALGAERLSDLRIRATNLDAASIGGSGDVLADGVRLAVLDIDSVDDGASFSATHGLPVDVWGDDLTLLASHFPLVSRAVELDECGFKYAGDLVDRALLLEEVVARTAPTVVLSGHLHIRDACSTGPVLQLLFPALIEHPFECSIIELAADEGTWRLSRLAVPLHAATFDRSPIFVPPVERWSFDGGEWLSHQFSPKEATA